MGNRRQPKSHIFIVRDWNSGQSLKIMINILQMVFWVYITSLKTYQKMSLVALTHPDIWESLILETIQRLRVVSQHTPVFNFPTLSDQVILKLFPAICVKIPPFPIPPPFVTKYISFLILLPFCRKIQAFWKNCILRQRRELLKHGCSLRQRAGITN